MQDARPCRCANTLSGAQLIIQVHKEQVSTFVEIFPRPPQASSIIMLGASILLAVLAPAVLATPVARSTYAVKETHYVPRKWVQKGRAPKNQMLALQIGVKQGDFDELERHLYEGMLWSM